LIFENITPAQFAAMEAQAEKTTGLAIVGSQGTAKSGGIEIGWLYADDMLTITPMSLEAKLASGVVEADMKKLIAATSPSS
jgi:hypothetical protein